MKLWNILLDSRTLNPGVEKSIQTRTAESISFTASRPPTVSFTEENISILWYKWCILDKGHHQIHRISRLSARFVVLGYVLSKFDVIQESIGNYYQHYERNIVFRAKCLSKRLSHLNTYDYVMTLDFYWVCKHRFHRKILRVQIYIQGNKTTKSSSGLISMFLST